MRRIILIIISFINGIALSQEGNVLFTDKDSVVSTDKSIIESAKQPECRHQIGIGLSKFVNAAFPSDSNAFLLEYRYLKTPAVAYRLGGDYRADTAKDSNYELALKIGIDRLFKDYKKWQFYYGIDLWGRYLYYKDRRQHFTNIAINPFFGVLFRLSKNFSVSTEPGFFVKYSIRRDRQSFDPEAQAEWFESRLAKIGFVQLNFHF
nr:hypothetical protein [uncultured Capnocytophaga sp.]